VCRYVISPTFWDFTPLLIQSSSLAFATVDRTPTLPPSLPYLTAAAMAEWMSDCWPSRRASKA